SSYLRNLFSKTARRQYVRNYCDVMKTKPHETCAQDVVASLKQALGELTAKQGKDMSKWVVPSEWIKFQKLGAGSVPDIPWQNRGTHNHIVEITSDAG